MRRRQALRAFCLFEYSLLSNEVKRNGLQSQGLCHLAESVTLTQGTRSFSETAPGVWEHKSKGERDFALSGFACDGDAGMQGNPYLQGGEHGDHAHCAWLESLGRVHRSSEFLI